MERTQGENIKSLKNPGKSRFFVLAFSMFIFVPSTRCQDTISRQDNIINNKHQEFISWGSQPKFIPGLLPSFFEVMNSEFVVNFKTDAIFIVICGSLFYSSIMTPLQFSYFIWLNTAPELNQIIQIMNMTFYAIFFISLMKAYLCPSPNQKQLQSFPL